MKKTISELFVKHSMHTNQALINDLVKLFDKQKQEERDRIVKEIKAFDKKVAGSPGCYDYRCGISGVLQTIDPDNEDYIKPEKLTNT